MLKLRHTASALLTVVALAGCVSVTPDQTPPRKIAGSFDELLDHRLSLPDLNDFEREVYQRAKESGRISQADHDEAYSRLSACMTESGKPITLRKLKNGLYRITSTPLDPNESTEHAIAIISSCEDSTTGFIPELFQIQQVNPELIGDSFEVTYRCLERAGLVPDGYSLERFKKAQLEPPPPGKRSTDDLPFDLNSEDFQACEIGKM
ncbi:hypothetical protein SPF06_03040 [Sinomonas sp. JGH33]|uniref:Lipoprotein n=1 Tax=Sinomonas terricola TaxID=3110330 RepID=A0ABU5T1Z9_9MICC|nr:hypothetical protein [Sinomonas sp. JGH33]MEA5453688.1 hypothetical protein [Sinomonas sp. JGH33]